MVVAEEEEQQIVDNVDCNSHNNNQNDHQNNQQQQQQDPNHLSIMDDNLDVNRLLDNPSPQMQQINGLIIDQTNNPTSPSLQRQDSVDIVAKPIPDGKFFLFSTFC